MINPSNLNPAMTPNTNPSTKQPSASQNNSETYSSEDWSDSQDEGVSGYRKGGYHPVSVGEVYNNRYRIEKKLGWGHFSTVWLSIDLNLTEEEENYYVALKIQKSASHYTEAAIDEIELLEKIKTSDPRGSRYAVQLLDHFYTYGPNGKHMCMVFEVLGDNLLKLIKKYDYKGIPVETVKDITRNMLVGLDYIHTKCSIIHTDLKPENVLLTARTLQLETIKEKSSSEQIEEIEARLGSAKETKNTKKKLRKKLKKLQRQVSGAGDSGVESATSQESNSVSVVELGDKLSNLDSSGRYARAATRLTARPIVAKLADFGNACWTYHHFTDEVTTRQYRSPEAIVVHDYDTGVDMWALACMIFELITGDYLFDPRHDTNQRYSRDEDHLALMVELLGKMPKVITTGGSRSKEFFDRRGELRRIQHLEYWPMRNVLREKYNFSEEDAEALSSFLLPMLELDPAVRITAREALKHPWLDEDGSLSGQFAASMKFGSTLSEPVSRLPRANSF